jgi:VCBS repeat-containing protein
VKNNIPVLYGYYDIKINGEWTYTLDTTNSVIIALGVGQSITDTIIITSEDGTTKELIITINGVNEPAIIILDDTSPTSVSVGVISITGLFKNTDVDNNNENNVFQLAENVSTTYGNYDIAVDGTWTYRLDNYNNDLIKLPENDILNDEIIATSYDGTQLTTQLSIIGILYAGVTLDNTIIYENNLFVGNITIDITSRFENKLPPVTDGLPTGFSYYLSIVSDDTTDDSDLFELIKDDEINHSYKLQFKSTNMPNYEIKNNYILSTVVKSTYTDDIYNTSSQFNIIILDSNDTPSNIILSNNTIAENQEGIYVGNITFNDEDIRDISNYIFTIIGDDGHKYYITPSQIINKTTVVGLYLKSTHVINYSVKPIENIKIVITDKDTINDELIKIYQQSFDIIAIEQNYFANELILNNNIIDENMSGIIIGELSIIDDYEIFNRNQYQKYLITGTDADLVEIIGNTLKLKDGVQIDFETNPEMTLIIKYLFNGFDINNVLLNGTIIFNFKINVLNNTDTVQEIQIIDSNIVSTIKLTERIEKTNINNNIITVDSTTQIQIGNTLQIKSSIYNEINTVIEILSITTLKLKSKFVFSYNINTKINAYNLISEENIMENSNIDNIRFIMNSLNSSNNLTINPEYETYSTTISNNAICNLRVPVQNFENIFLFMHDSDESSDNIDGLLYAVDSSKWNRMINTSISSNLNITQTAVIEDNSLIKKNTKDVNKYIYYDYVRFLTYNVTGTFSGIMFDNEMELRDNVKNLDVLFHSHIIQTLHHVSAGAGVAGGKIGDIMTNGAPGDAEGKSYGSFNTHTHNIAKNIMLTLLNGTPVQQQRIQTLFSSYSASTNDMWRSIPLIQNDVITFSVLIAPKTSNPLGLSIIPNKTYVINLILI